MATKPRLKKSAATLQHPIRVVPLHRPELQRVAPAVAPRLTYRGGPPLTPVEVFPVFWCAAWNPAPPAPLVPNFTLFFHYLPTTPRMHSSRPSPLPWAN